MKNYIIFGLLGAGVLAGVSSQTLFKKTESQQNSELSQTYTKNSTIMLDPETGEIMSDFKKVEEQRALMKKSAEKDPKDHAEEEKEKIVMTEMDDGAIKLSLGKRYRRPQSVSVDENGNVVAKDNTELHSAETE